MSLVLLNLQSNQQIKLDNHNPLIIGRGNVYGCFDKRVSRNHGRITCTRDGKIHIVALHCNPCFFTRNGVPPVLQLNKDEEETLNEGDCLGLLPNAFWFQIISIKETKVNEKTSKSNNTEIDKSDDNSFVENMKCLPSENENNSNLFPIPSINQDTNSNSAGTSKGFGTIEFEKTRRLPLWMYEIDESVETNKNKNKHMLSNNQETLNKKQKVISEIEVREEPHIKSEAGIEEEDEIVVINVASTSKVMVNESNTLDESLNCATLENSSQAQGESSKVTSYKDGYESDVQSDLGNSSKRPICQYEGNCYRKNPQHKLDFCHPGDADFIPSEERPVCQYGAGCYRRNKRHKVEFKHTLPSSSLHNISSSSCTRTSLAPSPLPVKRRRGKVKKQSSDYENDDEYDLEDPFINDASSDEYVPSDWDSEVQESEDFDGSQEDER